MHLTHVGSAGGVIHGLAIFGPTASDPTWEACWARGVGKKSLRRLLQSIRVLQTHTGEAEETPTHHTNRYSRSATCD